MLKDVIIKLIELIYPTADLPPQVVFLFSILVIIVLFASFIAILFLPIKCLFQCF
ncbi:hypothetical protein [Spiroplasma endosymbiont of Dilophus febrilis]|uniref:hypothetical protein n=1 Tax=Spiroplasma endosymbiont of Dilophus febrilis TaxID=3066292 RepID=UPI00313E5CC1